MSTVRRCYSMNRPVRCEGQGKDVMQRGSKVNTDTLEPIGGPGDNTGSTGSIVDEALLGHAGLAQEVGRESPALEVS